MEKQSFQGSEKSYLLQPPCLEDDQGLLLMAEGRPHRHAAAVHHGRAFIGRPALIHPELRTCQLIQALSELSAIGLLRQRLGASSLGSDLHLNLIYIYIIFV